MRRLGEQIGKGFNQLNVSKKQRKLEKKQQHKAERQALKDYDVTKLPKRYSGWAS